MFQITVTLEDYLNRGYDIPINIEKFIKLNITGEEIDIKTLFIKRNLYKDIGSEVEELFKHNLEVAIDEALVIFNPRLKLLQDNFSKLMDRTVQEEVNGETSADRNNEVYYNPINANSSKLTNRDTSASSGSYHEIKTRSFGYFKSNGEVLKNAMDIDDTVSSILKYLDRCFIGEY